MVFSSLGKNYFSVDSQKQTDVSINIVVADLWLLINNLNKMGDVSSFSSTPRLPSPSTLSSLQLVLINVRLSLSLMGKQLITHYVLMVYGHMW